MKKTIYVLLKESHVELGKKGNIKNVTPGYAFNYLIPKNIAEIATKKKIKHIKMFEEIKNKKTETNKIVSYQIQKKLNNIQSINLKKKKGEKNLIFGSITEKDISQYIQKNTSINLEKKYIHIPNIKTLGSFEIKIDLSNNIFSTIELNILPQNI
uniref:Large ribosomal subunit protein bL9c n=1 Tax=Bostrychia moritziana TaxID=103713 RepID=A0A1Z1M767_BOSMO|nr:ribosomal protein L9 [Bostrychia moritziana]ARW61742.1 ribosomal protein L9 [Bostrychia moritziana]